MTDRDWIAGVRGHLAELDALGVRHLVGPEEARVPYEPLSSYGIGTPALVVAIGNLWLPEALPPGREWFAVSHDGQILVTVVRPAPGVEEGMRRLCEVYAGTRVPRRPTIDQLVEYRERLRELLGVECVPHHTTFSEGLYPILPSELGKLTDEPFDLPEDAMVMVLGPLPEPEPSQVFEEAPGQDGRSWPCEYEGWIAAALRHHGVRRGPGDEPFRALRYYVPRPRGHAGRPGRLQGPAEGAGRGRGERRPGHAWPGTVPDRRGRAAPSHRRPRRGRRAW
ncbi:hypothetical protein AB0B45_18755 [Nonomuraea sp. NPDC049152]|uniref:hypothetical protein n=1 Tax=Nonomuraea sp. NPDC049152 TaxID=3154350 RepID=UPI0033CC1DCB